MTIEEYTEIMDKSNFMIDSVNPYDMEIKKALEKQIPRKIKQDIVDGKMARWCPNGCEITSITQYSSINYCPKCGQAINWE